MIYNQQIYKVIKQTFLGKYSDKPISVFTGEFGTGKSTLINNLLNDIEINQLFDVSLLLDDFTNIENTFDLVIYLLTAIDTKSNAQFDWEKSEVLKLRYLFYSLTNNEPFDFEQLNSLDTSKYDEKSKQTINELKGIESRIYNAWLFDLLQIIDSEISYKFNTEILKVENLKKKLILAIDNTDLVQIKAFKFITNILEFINHNKIGDLGYLEVNEENNFNLNDLLDIRFIITFRDSSAPVRFNHRLCDYYKFVHLHHKVIEERLKLENLQDEITTNEVFDYTGANPYLFELLIAAIKNGSSDDEIMNFYVSGFNYLIRLHNHQETQFLLICSFLDTINEYALKLFPDFKDDKEFISNIINRDDILETVDNSLMLKKHIKNIVNAGFKLLEPDLYHEYNERIGYYKNCKTIIDAFEGEDFDAFRNLAYFKYFDLTNGIEKAFQTDAPKAKAIVEKYKDKFDIFKHTYQIRPEILEKVVEYNRIVDGVKFEMKYALIKSVWFDYAHELKDRNNALDLEIKKIAAELRLLDEENTKLNQKADDTKRGIINLTAEIDKIKAKHDPLANVTGDRENLVFSLIMLVLFIGILLFTIITNEDYHIVLFTSINLTNMLLLFTLLVAGFFGYRYIDKVKTKILNKYEIERLAKLLDKTTDEKLKLIEKSSLVQADLNAVLSKILELKRHIDRINIQILENLAKLNEPFV